MRIKTFKTFFWGLFVPLGFFYFNLLIYFTSIVILLLFYTEVLKKDYEEDKVVILLAIQAVLCICYMIATTFILWINIIYMAK